MVMLGAVLGVTSAVSLKPPGTICSLESRVGSQDWPELEVVDSVVGLVEVVLALTTLGSRPLGRDAARLA